MQLNKYFFDENQTRYQLIKSTPGKTIYNWLFFPGGPGIDSSYLLSLINNLDIEGNCWLIDLPLNGNNLLNLDNKIDSNTIYKNWDEYFISAVNKFDNPIFVGHSFSGYYPLFFPELETILKGLVILSSSPVLPSLPTQSIYDFEKIARENDLPFGDEIVTDFLNNPNLNTLTTLYLSVVPYEFPAENIIQGIDLAKNIIANIDTSFWWLTDGVNKYVTITWIPEKLPTLIVGGSRDFSTPLCLFEKDLRFKRNNIEIISIPDAGHFPWMEQEVLINDAICLFNQRLNLKEETTYA